MNARHPSLPQHLVDLAQVMPRLAEIESAIERLKDERKELNDEIKGLEQARTKIIIEANDKQERLDFTAPSVPDFESLSAADARVAIERCTDIDELQSWDDIEGGRKKSRVSILAAIANRMGELATE